MGYVLKVHGSEQGTIVAAADHDLIGENFEEDGISLRIDPAFYKDEEADLDTIVTELDRCITANLVGAGLIGALQETGHVAKDDVMEVDGVPHVQLFRL